MPRRATTLAVISIALALSIGVPEVLLRSAAADAGADPCGRAGEPRPPEPGFYGSLRRLDTLAMIPWTSGRAVQSSTDAAMACLRTYTDRCGVLRDHAVEQARVAVEARVRGEGSGADVAAEAEDWRHHLDAEGVVAFCAEWAGWREWLAAEGLDAGAACPVCDE